MVNDLNECVLESVLANFTNLVGLHIVGCPKVDHVTVLQLISRTPLLESLSMTTSVSFQLGPFNLSFLNFEMFSSSRKTRAHWPFHLHRFAS